VEPDGSTLQHADLDALATDWNEIVVDGRGSVYVNGGCDFDPGEGDPPGIIALVRPDGSVRQVADAIAFPNGMVVTPDNSTLFVAESFARRLTAFDIAADGRLSNRRVWAAVDGYPDGICLDADGAVWCAAMLRCLRLAEGGEVLDTIELDRNPFACMLGGPDGRTLFMLAAEWAAPTTWTGRSPPAPVRCWRCRRLRRMPGGRKQRRSGAGARYCGVPNNSAERGVHVLKRVPGEWPLFAATR
jgi:sugar lactone lactonase YvrE